ncbi:geranylgeranyl reductase family protein [Streptomyces fragilis]|uniref:geranylgeranyl reductase family protein n=1 Tax=Streptomyces fragilis TaxID=67301 RepID=UPI0024DEA43B|nr:geranylgeranyl reductase family protein [Streptomyces fragilis]
MPGTEAFPDTADVIVVGAGPAGSTAAHHLARAGLDVLLLEKTAFPREKVCGDGLTPRAVKELVAMGIDISPEAGWLRNKGLRVISGGMRMELDWPQLATFPDHGLVRRRDDFDERLAHQARKAGARLVERCNVTGPVLDERTGRITGVHTRLGADKRPVTFRAPLVVAADGNSSRLSLAMGLHRRDDRPMGVAVRTYFTSPRHDDDYLESWLEVRDCPEPDGRLLPGYAWVFGMGDGTCNVGLGVLDASLPYRDPDWRGVLRTWCASLPEEWGFTPENMTGPVRGAALPMGYNRQPHYSAGLLLVGDAAGAVNPVSYTHLDVYKRQPHYSAGLLLVGDAAGAVNPFNGEGIAYAMESGRIAAEVVVQARARRGAEGRETALRHYPQVLKAAHGGYYTLGRAFVKLIGRPAVMKLAAERGLSHPQLMRIAFRLVNNLTDPTGGDAVDRVLNALARITPRS